MSYIRTASSAAVVALLVGLVPGAALAQSRASDAYFEFLMARRLESTGNTQGALAALQRAVAADPTSAEIKAELASFYLRQNPPQREAGEKAAKDALALDENNVEANRALGYLYANVVDTEARTMSPQMATALTNAILHLERAQAGTEGTDANLLYTLGRLYTTAGEPKKAIDALTRVAIQNPDNPQVRIALARSHASAGDLKSAIGTLSEVVEYLPNVATDLGRYQQSAGLYREAAATYTIALAVRPNDRALKLARLQALYGAKEFSQAAALAGEARRQHPDDVRFAQFQARALFDAGDRSAGIAVAETAAKAFPKDSQTQLTLADLYGEAGRDADKERVLRQVINLNPSDAQTLNTLGYLLAVRGEKLDEAIALVRRALEKDPDNGAYLDSLGWAYFRRGDFNEAYKHLAAAAERMPASSEVLDHLGDVQARRGQLQEAITAWTRALAGDGGGIDRVAVEKKVQDARQKLAR